ncbi:MAG: RdgB/HAM1 family non-canonical purine NTP pyrophosphatase [Actinobacteria bacterium]|uniref:dITP/XTP pyrophosphatase n=1 Tax=freshwater metagenome TaxID=449393 RepID=A0A6J7JCN1_9ZZZZ|nr:RdgB/HAM1 family non-canonical purine NTP pyrophosphatase [Actinomycetota bacterium]
MELVCASANPDKVAEIASILAAAGVELLARPASVADVIEDADTLVGNARLKAVAIAEATGLPAVADDTGLEVDALGGVPGVRSARFAGEHATYDENVELLLARLDAAAAMSPEQRTARFRTVVLLRWPDGNELVVEGVCEGVITAERRGTNGFGYDPVFAPVEAGGSTFAELDAAQKHAISHRGRALRALASELEDR